MKLLLDENLSRRMVPFLQNTFPGSSQVAMLGLEKLDDRDIWRFAKENDFVIVTRDADFEELSSVLGAPPQVVWLRIPNQSKSAVLNLLAKHEEDIQQLLGGTEIACIELGSDGVLFSAGR